MLITTRIALAAPIDRVWRALTAFARYPEWNPYLVRVEGEPVAGSTIRVHAVVAGRVDPLVQDVLVVAAEPYTMRWEGGLPDRAQFRGDHWFVLAPNDEGCVLDHFEAFDGSLAATILAQHGATIKSNFELFNNGLKQHVESDG